jgi:Ca-activated chloride channel family protein
MRARNLGASLTLLVLGLSYAALPALDAGTMQAPGGMTYLRVSVIDNKKVPVGTLKAENFQLTEDNKEQKVTYFSAPGEPTPLGVILALSASGPVKNPGQRDRVSVEITGSVDKVKEASPAVVVEQLPLDSDGIYNLVQKHVTNLEKQPNPRKALVIVSDGLIPSGARAESQPVPKALLEATRVLNFPIYFLFPVSNRPEPAFTESNNYVVGYYLQQMAEYSGGEFLIGQVENDLPKVAESLRDSVKNMYILGFQSTNAAKDGKWRKLAVKMAPGAPSNLKVSARARYFVPKG